MSGYIYRSHWGWTWRQEREGGPFVVRDPDGVRVAYARSWWVAAGWACAQRLGGEG